jgi:hypothetical protein
MIRPLVPALLLGFAAGNVLGHGPASSPPDNEARKIQFPNTAEYQTIVLDPHTHSVFSDGHVWPRIRIEEALRDGLDAIAITEHLEYQPHIADIPHPDRNRAYEEAVAAAAGTPLIVIAGVEITRDAPAGHMNAIFIEDANTLHRPPAAQTDVKTLYVEGGSWPAQAAIEAANAQHAFVFWNHPFWGADFPNGIPVIPVFHRDNAKAHLLHGIEIANGNDYSEETFQIALDYGLTLMGVSDVHDLIDWDYDPHNGGHRPVTLVFATERSPAAIRQALFDGRTVVWFKNLLIGRRAQLDPLLAASLTLVNPRYDKDGDVLSVSLVNSSDASFELMNGSRFTFFDSGDLIQVPAHGSTDLRVKTGTRLDRIDLAFDVLNALTAPKETAQIKLGATL